MAKNIITATSAEQSIGEAQTKLANELAGMIDTSVNPIVTGLAAAKREYQGGPFVVMTNVLSFLIERGFDLSRLPVPSSKDGNNPAHYLIKTDTGKKVNFKRVYFYDQLALSLPSVMAHKDRVSQLQRSMAKDKSKVKTDDIPKEMFERPIHSRMAEVDRLNQQVTVAKSNVSTAFELYHQLNAFGELDKVEVVISHAIGDDGRLQNGEDGTDYVVEKINSPITVRSTIKGREDIDTGRYSVGSFLKFDVAKASEAPGGATFQSLEATLAKGTGEELPETGVSHIKTLDTFVKFTNELSSYLSDAVEGTDKAKWSALQKLAEKDDEKGNDFFFALAYIVNNCKVLVDNPRAQVRYQAMLNAMDDKKAA